jgi:hypothetical protein
MRRLLLAAVTCLAVCPVVQAAVIPIDVNPLTGSPALTTPGRQIVNNGLEPSISFDPATDVFLINTDAFDVTAPLSFANGLSSALPTSHSEVIVLQDGPPLAAGAAANAIAARVTTPGAGFFVYFNSGLDLPRLVYSTNLDDGTADLVILARLTNQLGNPGVMPTFTSANFVGVEAVPEPSLLALAGVAALGFASRRRREQA